MLPQQNLQYEASGQSAGNVNNEFHEVWGIQEKNISQVQAKRVFSFQMTILRLYIIKY
jgi:hypothetical protein